MTEGAWLHTYGSTRDLREALEAAGEEIAERNRLLYDLLRVVNREVEHLYDGDCPDEHDMTQRNVRCEACRIIRAAELTLDP